MTIPFNKPHLTGEEWKNISQAYRYGQLAGDGYYTNKCEKWLEENIGCERALLTHSCTASLEMAAMLIDVQEGDEIIMPSYTFVSTANAFVIRGAKPVFVDIRDDTQNIDEAKIEEAITDKTKAIVVVHYAGVGCDMTAICNIAQKYNLFLIEDAAQAIMSHYNGKPLGSFGQFATLSFHETKNIIAGEGGALLINSDEFVERSEIIREKGTNRKKFFRGSVDKYTWVDIGSSYLPGELISAFLYAQLCEAVNITERRQSIWTRYHEAFQDLEENGLVVRPIVPPECTPNAHIYYLLFHDRNQRDVFIDLLSKNDIHAVFHYVPLHDSPMGYEVGRISGDLKNTERTSDRIVRLPLWVDMDENAVEDVIATVRESVYAVNHRSVSRI